MKTFAACTPNHPVNADARATAVSPDQDRIAGVQMSNNTTTDEAVIRELIEDWAKAVRLCARPCRPLC